MRHLLLILFLLGAGAGAFCQITPETSLVEVVNSPSRISGVAALLAMADANDDKALTDAVTAMSPAECLRDFQQLLLSRSQPPGLNLASGALLESLLSRHVKGQAEAITRWLLQPANQFPDLEAAHSLAAEAIADWGRTDGLAAAQFAASLAPDTNISLTTSSLLFSVCSSRGNVDSDGALAWAQVLPDADPRKVQALEGVFYLFNELHPDEAKASVEQLLGVNKAAPELAGFVAARLAQLWPNGPPAAAKWALSLPNVPARREALKAVVDVWTVYSAESLSEAVKWATSLPRDKTRGSTWGAVAVDWGYEGLVGSEIAAGSPKFFERLRINGVAARSWLSSLPPGADRDQALAIRDQAEESLMKQKIWR